MQGPQLAWRTLPAAALSGSADLRTHWDRLNDERGGVPVLCSTMVVTALEVLGSGVEQLLVAEAGGSVMAMVVASPTGHLRWGTFQPSQMPLGAWVASTTLQPVDLARSLLRGPLAPSLLMSFTQLEPRIAARAADLPDTLGLDYVDTGWIDLDGDFETYWQGRGKNMRANHRKQRNRLAASGTDVQLRVIRDPSQVGAAVSRYAEIEARSWKAREGTAIQEGNTQERFYRALLERLSSEGAAAVYEYWFGDDQVASNLVIERGSVMVVLKTTYDDAFGAYSPAFLLREAELQQLFAEGRIRRLEFYGRLMEWHLRWTDKSVRLYHVTTYRWPLLKALSEVVGRRRRLQAHPTEPPVVTGSEPRDAVPSGTRAT